MQAINTRVIFFAGDFYGRFTTQNLNIHAVRARDWYLNNHKTSAAKNQVNNNDKYHNQSHRLARGRHAVLGWYNLDTKDFNYVGVQRLDGGKYRYLFPNGNSGVKDTFKHARYTTNGFKIMIAFADDDQGGVLWRFEGPN